MTTRLPDAVTTLPIMALANDVAAALSRGDVSPRAEPGAGKSTGLPLALLLSGTVAGRIVMLRRSSTPSGAWTGRTGRNA